MTPRRRGRHLHPGLQGRRPRRRHRRPRPRPAAPPHPDGTEVAPAAWEAAFTAAAEAAGGLADVAALSVGGQQHGMVCLDEDGAVVRDALLWNDVRSAGAAADLITELGDGDEAAGRQAWADAVGLVPVASFTATKLRWLADAEPANADRTAAVCLPHDWLTWRLSADRDLAALVTDRGDASGTAYWSARTGEYRLDLLELAMRGRRPAVPRVAGPAEAGRHPRRVDGGARAGHRRQRRGRARAGRPAGRRRRLDRHLRRRLRGDDHRRRRRRPAPSPASPTRPGDHLPLVATLNAARVLDAAAALLGVDHATLSDLALSAPSGADGLVLVPYLEGERTPNLPRATGSVHGLTLRTVDPGALGARRRRGPAVRARRRHRGGRRPGRHRRAGAAGRRRRPLPGRAAAGAGHLRPAGARARRPASTSPTAPPARRPGCSPATTRRRSGRSRACRTFEAPAGPRRARERYAEVRGRTDGQ